MGLGGESKAKKGMLNPFNKSTHADKHKVERSSYSTSSSGSKAIYDGEGDVIPLYEGREYLLYFDFLFRFWIYFDTTPHAVAYLSAFGFWIGGMLFMIGTFSALSPAVIATIRPGSCGTDAYSWWTAFPYLVGDVIWLCACYLQLVESLNMDYEMRVELWEAGKKDTPRPRYKWVGVQFRAWDWWGAFCYDFGVAMYTVAQAMYYVSLCPNIHISNNVYTITINYFYLVAGILFFLAGVFYTVVLGSPWIIPSILVPFNREGWFSMMYWAIWLYFWGGVMFCMSGIFLYWNSPNNLVLDPNIYKIENAIGFGGGAFVFFLGALLLLMRQSRGRCRPSYASLNTNSDLSVHGGGGYKAMTTKQEMV